MEFTGGLSEKTLQDRFCLGFRVRIADNTSSKCYKHAVLQWQDVWDIFGQYHYRPLQTLSSLSMQP